MKKRANKEKQAQAANSKALTLEKRLLTYSVAAGAALALSQPAEATIHYSGIKNLAVNLENQNVPVDLDGDHVDDFVFKFLEGPGNLTKINRVVISGTSWLRQKSCSTFTYTNNEQTHTYKSCWYSPKRLSCDQVVSSLAPDGFQPGNLGILNCLAYGPVYCGGGQFAGGKEGYIGVKFGSPKLYGWIHYKAKSSPDSPEPLGKIVDWAYEDSGAQIKACEIGPAPVPTLTEWGLLLFAALLLYGGVKKIRKERPEV
jgi:hypothetical protein